SVCSLNKKVSGEILKGISLLQLLSGKESTPDPFADFKIAFRNRYNDEWVPLVEVLDTEWGIGYGKFRASVMDESPLIDKLVLSNTQDQSTKHGDTESFKWQLYQDAITKEITEVTIDDNVL